MTIVDLVWLGSQRQEPWPAECHSLSDPSPKGLHDLLVSRLPGSKADAWLFWDSRLGEPDRARIEALLNRPIHVWHAGLRLGNAGLPAIMDFLRPTWTLNRDPASEIDAMSWRLSLLCCLVRTDVLRKMGHVRGSSTTCWEPGCTVTASLNGGSSPFSSLSL